MTPLSVASSHGHRTDRLMRRSDDWIPTGPSTADRGAIKKDPGRPPGPESRALGCDLCATAATTGDRLLRCRLLRGGATLGSTTLWSSRGLLCSRATLCRATL